MTELKQKIYDVVKKIPCGKVMTYGQVARAAGCNSPRYVGTVLHHNPDPTHIPCHRVVSVQGKVADTFAFGGGGRQQVLLEGEGIVFIKGIVDVDTYRFIDEL